MDDDKALCFRCYEDMPVAEEPAAWRMGELRPLSKAPKRVRDAVRYDKGDIRGEPMLCGNCYFDLTDED